MPFSGQKINDTFEAAVKWAGYGFIRYVCPLKKSNYYPDLSKDGSAFDRWNRVANELQTQGFRITVSTFLDNNATEAQNAAGLEVADFLVAQWNEYPPDWDNQSALIDDSTPCNLA